MYRFRWGKCDGIPVHDAEIHSCRFDPVTDCREEAGEARPRSQHTGSSLLRMLRGKSPCLGAESVIGRPRGQILKLAVKPRVELFGGAGHLQQQSHAVSTPRSAN